MPLPQKKEAGSAKPHEREKKSGCCVPSGEPRPGRVKAAGVAPGGHPTPERLIAVRGGRSFVGTQKPVFPQDGEGPVRKTSLKPYRIDPYAVTNAWFARFIRETGYKTDAELYNWSLVFKAFLDHPDGLPAPVQTPWWRKVEGADWAHPNGPGSSIDGLEDHPVTHISWNDAMAFAAWAGGRLPTEAQWEHAARGGPEMRTYPWGEQEPTDNSPLCNIWQGRFPEQNTARDGYLGTAPVALFKANELGLHHMVGNVWEWCADIFRVRSQSKSARRLNAGSLKESIRLLKGGSYLCHKSYCYRYRIAARTGVRADSSAGHTGLRLVFDAE